MAIIARQCPHCLTEQISLAIVHSTEMDRQTYIAHLSCPRCKLPSGARLLRNTNAVEWLNLLPHGLDVSDHGWSVIEFWPSAPKPIIPEHLPTDIERVYLQAERNFPIDGNEEAAGTMYRKALDVGLKVVEPEAKGTLQVRINKLVENHLLTPSLGEWAHQIRQLGNDTAHESNPPSRAELEILRSH